MRKFHQWNIPISTSSKFHHTSSKHNFEHLNQPLGLSIFLWVNVVLKLSRVPKANCNSFQNLEVNRGSLSDTIDNDTPCNHTTSRSKEYSILTGIKWADFMSLSIITHTESCFLCVRGRPDTKSITILFHFHCGTRMGFNRSDGTWCSAFTC